MLAHILQLPKKGVADLYQFATVYMQMHVHKIFLPHMIYVTGYWKTDHVRTFGQLLFIGPANSHTHTLPVHCCINGLS